MLDLTMWIEFLTGEWAMLLFIIAVTALLEVPVRLFIWWEGRIPKGMADAPPPKPEQWWQNPANGRWYRWEGDRWMANGAGNEELMRFPSPGGAPRPSVSNDQIDWSSTRRRAPNDTDVIVGGRRHAGGRERQTCERDTR